MSASHTVAREAPVPLERLFDVVVAEDVLPHVLHRVGPVPGVSATRDLTGPWDTPGFSRTVVLDDGSTARETVLRRERPDRFEYQVQELTGGFGRLVDHAIGSWSFSATGPDASRFTWTYTFFGRGRWADVVLAVVTRTAWARYMARCADRCVERAAAVS